MDENALIQAPNQENVVYDLPDETVSKCYTANGLEYGRGWNINYWDLHSVRCVLGVMEKPLQDIFFGFQPEIKQILNGVDFEKVEDSFQERVRERFWVIFDAFENTRAYMSVKNLSRNLCSSAEMDKALGDPEFCAYIMHPTITYADRLNKSLNKGLDRIQDILEMDLVKENGDPSAPAINAVFRAVKFLDDRVKGKPGSRIEIVKKSLNVNMDRQQMDAVERGLADSLSLEKMKRDVAKLEQETAIVDNIVDMGSVHE